MHLLGQLKQKSREVPAFLETLSWLLLRAQLNVKNQAADDREKQMRPLLLPHVLVRMINSVLDGEEETPNQPLLHVLTKAMNNASDDGKQLLPLPMLHVQVKTMNNV